MPADTWDARGARGEARYRGWLPPAAWPSELIDDPAAEPLSVPAQLPASAHSPVPPTTTKPATETPSQRARTWHRGTALVDDLEWMLKTGETIYGVCRRLGMSSSAIYKALQRANRPDLWSRLTDWTAAA